MLFFNFICQENCFFCPILKLGADNTIFLLYLGSPGPSVASARHILPGPRHCHSFRVKLCKFAEKSSQEFGTSNFEPESLITGIMLRVLQQSW